MVLPAIGLVLGALFLGFLLLVSCVAFFKHPSNESAIATAVTAALLFLYVFTMDRFFRKRRSAIKLMQLLCALDLVFAMVNMFVRVFSANPPLRLLDNEWFGVPTACFAFFWLAYFSESKRVTNTFVETA